MSAINIPERLQLWVVVEGDLRANMGRCALNLSKLDIRRAAELAPTSDNPLVEMEAIRRAIARYLERELGRCIANTAWQAASKMTGLDSGIT